MDEDDILDILDCLLRGSVDATGLPELDKAKTINMSRVLTLRLKSGEEFEIQARQRAKVK